MTFGGTKVTTSKSGGSELSTSEKSIGKRRNILIKVKHSNLPHIDILDHYQFVTFRTKDSIDGYIQKLYGSDDSEKIKQYKIDSYLDKSENGAFLNGQIVLDIQKYFQSYDKKMYDLIALSVMPNHIHILFKQKDELKNIMRILKGGSANLVNKSLDKKGQVWAGDYFDKLIRNEEHFSLVYEYIKYNAIKAGLDDAKDRFYGSYE